MTREEGFALLREHVKTDRVLRHSLAVEAAMRAYAEKYGEDVERWGLLGLLHDIDYERFPEEHPAHAPELLKDTGLDGEFIDSILSHGHNADVPRDMKERQCLHAVDEMASFIIAVALMRPDRLEGLGAKSVKKKLKDRRFAEEVDREEIASSMELLGEDFPDHVDTIVKGLKEQEEKISKAGFTLLS